MEIVHKVVQYAGGAFVKWPYEGRWEDEDVLYIDPLVKIGAVVPASQQSIRYFTQLKREIEQQLDQMLCWITVEPIWVLREIGSVASVEAFAEAAD